MTIQQASLEYTVTAVGVVLLRQFWVSTVVGTNSQSNFPVQCLAPTRSDVGSECIHQAPTVAVLLLLIFTSSLIWMLMRSRPCNYNQVSAGQSQHRRGNKLSRNGVLILMMTSVLALLFNGVAFVESEADQPAVDAEHVYVAETAAVDADLDADHVYVARIKEDQTESASPTTESAAEQNPTMDQFMERYFHRGDSDSVITEAANKVAGLSHDLICMMLIPPLVLMLVMRGLARRRERAEDRAADKSVDRDFEVASTEPSSTSSSTRFRSRLDFEDASSTSSWKSNSFQQNPEQTPERKSSPWKRIPSKVVEESSGTSDEGLSESYQIVSQLPSWICGLGITGIVRDTVAAVSIFACDLAAKSCLPGSNLGRAVNVFTIIVCPEVQAENIVKLQNVVHTADDLNNPRSIHSSSVRKTVDWARLQDALKNEGNVLIVSQDGRVLGVVQQPSGLGAAAWQTSVTKTNSVAISVQVISGASPGATISLVHGTQPWTGQHLYGSFLKDRDQVNAAIEAALNSLDTVSGSSAIPVEAFCIADDLDFAAVDFSRQDSVDFSRQDSGASSQLDMYTSEKIQVLSRSSSCIVPGSSNAVCNDVNGYKTIGFRQVQDEKAQDFQAEIELDALRYQLESAMVEAQIATSFKVSVEAQNESLRQQLEDVEKKHLDVQRDQMRFSSRFQSECSSWANSRQTSGAANHQVSEPETQPTSRATSCQPSRAFISESKQRAISDAVSKFDSRMVSTARSASAQVAPEESYSDTDLPRFGLSSPMAAKQDDRPARPKSGVGDLLHFLRGNLTPRFS